MPDITIEGITYDLATAESLSLDEGIVLYDYSGLSIDEFMEHPSNPKALKALLHISVARKQVAMEFQTVSDLVGKVTFGELMETLDEEEDADVPPSQTASGEKSEESETSTGGNGTNGSLLADPEALPPASTGGPASANSRSESTPSELSHLGN